MSEFTDDVLGRYLDQQPGMRQALLHDPGRHMQVEALRRTLDMVERALTDEGVPEDVRRRVVNRVVWGDPAWCVEEQPKDGCEECAAEGCGAVDADDLDACGECSDCTG